jgi:hypothetical protein
VARVKRSLPILAASSTFFRTVIRTKTKTKKEWVSTCLEGDADVGSQAPLSLVGLGSDGRDVM